MKSRISLYFCRRNVYPLTALLLSFSLITMPFVHITFASSGAQRQVGNHSSGSRVPIATEKQSYRVNPNPAVPAPAPAPLVPSITATKVDTLISDDGDGKADPGGTEKIEYNITITNNGTDAADVVFTDDIDDHTELVGVISTQPIADPDTYTASGNIAISIAAPGVLANDRDPDTGNNSGLTVTKVQGVGANVGVATDTTATGRGGVKGKVTLLANGSFSYEPAPGFVGDDTFTYEISDGTKIDTSSVKITVSGMVWFISNNAGGSNLGTFSNPFTTIASFNTANATTGVAPDPKNGDFISLRTGTGTYSETDGINLRQDQKLIGNAVQFNTVFSADANSISAYTTFAGAAGAAPSIVTSGGNGIDLSLNNTLRGLNVGNTPGFFKVNGGAVGSPIINTISLTGTGGALNVSTSGAFGANVTFSTLESTSSPAANLNLIGVTGTLGITAAGTGFSNSTAASAAINVSGGTVAFSYAGNVSKGNAGPLVSISGGHSAGTIAFGTGTLSATSGTGLQFDNADGTYNFNGTTTLNGGDAGIDILNGSSGTFNFSASTTITSPTGAAFNVGSSPGNPNVTYNGTITHNTAGTRAVNIDGTTGGSIGINSVTAGSVAGGVGNTGININNANGSVSFTTLNLGTSGTRMTAQAITIAGGSGAKGLGTVTVFTTGSAQGIVSTTTTGSITIADGSVDTAGAAAFNLAGTSNASRTPLNIQLDTVNTSGGSAGIVLANTSATGSPGGFRILGTGGTCTNASTAGCSGGQIQNTTGSDSTTASAGSGVHMTNVDSVVLTRMHIHDHSNYGIRGVNVNGFTLNTSVLKGVNGNNPGGPFSEGSVVFDGTGASPAQGLVGTSSIINSDIRGGRSDNLRIDNDGGTLNLSVSGSTFRDTTDAADANDNIFVELGQTATGFVSITGSTFGETSGDHIQGNLINSAVGHFTITGNTFTGIGAAKPSTRFGMGILIAGGTWTGTCRYNISNNIMSGTRQGHAIHTNKGGPTGGTMEGTISGNTIGVAGNVDSGAAESSGITVASRGSSGSHVAVVSNNIIHQTDEFGINLELGEDNGAAVTSTASGLQVTVTGNTVDTPGANSLHGIHLNSGILPTDNNTACADIGGGTAALRNNVTTGANETNGGSDIRPRQRQASRVELPGYGGGPFDNAAVNAYITGRNNLTTVASSNNNDAGTATDGFMNTAGGAPCTQPTAPTLPSAAPLTSDAEAANRASIRSKAVAAVPASITSATAQSTQLSLLARAMNGVANFTSSVLSLVEPTAHASSETAASAQTSVNPVQPVQVAAASNNGPQKLAVKTDNRNRKTNSHHATMRPRAMMAAAMAGETVTVNIGTLRAGDSVTITFQVKVVDPPNLSALNPPHVSNQGQVAYNDGVTPQTPVVTDDPAVAGANNPTDTPVDLFDTSTTLVSDLNPSNFGDLVTFTATVAETPAQGSADPTGTVDFIDNFNLVDTVICNDVPLTAGSAQCQTSTLAPGEHNVRAVYSGDGNFESLAPSNVVVQMVNACTADPIVTSTADSGAGSLREALANVCNGDTITFNIAGAGPHTIMLTTGELMVSKDVDINNNSGESITVSGNNANRVFNINSGKTVSITSLTITGGSEPADVGGGIKNSGGTLTLNSSNVYGNTAGIGGGISSTGSLTINNSNIGGTLAGQPNSATAGSGGGIQNANGTVVVKNSSISGNTANNLSGAGGGIANEINGVLTVVNSTIANNSATQEGGAINNGAAVTVINSTISGNQAGLHGGGIRTNGVGSTLTVINSTISNNRADSDNDTVGAGGGITTFQSTTILRNTIVAGNFRGTGSTRDDVDGALDATSSFNLIGDGTGMTGITHGANGNQVGTSGSPIDAMLGLLANNGGPTLTHALLGGSPAVEAGSNANVPVDTFDVDGDANTAETLPVDQRGTGFPRIADSQDANTTQTVDIGAFELHPSIEDIANQTTAEDTPKMVTFNIGDDTGSLISTVTATSSNTALVPSDGAHLSFTGSGGSRTLTITPNADANSLADGGPTTITVTVTATNGRTAIDTFDLTVTEVNDAPIAVDDTLTAIDEDSGVRIIPFADLLANDSKGPANEATQTLTITNVSNPVGGTVAINGTNVEFTPTANFSGPASFDYTATDNGTTNGVADPKSDTATVSFTINGVNDPPSFVKGADQTVNEDAGPQTVVGWATSISAGPGETQTLTFNVSVTGTTGNLAFSSAPAINATTGTLTYTTSANTNGTATVSVTLSDDGSNTPPNSNTSPAQTFTITVNAVNDAPTFQLGPNPSVNENAGPQTINGFAFNFQPGPATATDESGQTLVGYTVTQTGTTGGLTFSAVPAINTAGTLTFTATGGSSGTATFDVVATDSGPGTPPNVNQSAPVSFTISVNAVNDPPVNTVPGPQGTNQNTPLIFSSGNGNQISVADSDAGASVIQVTLTATNGTITLSGTTGLSFSFSDANGTGVGDGTADPTMTFRGTLTNINAALNGMSFTPTNGFSGAATLTITSNDLGNTGAGGPQTDTDVVNIQVSTNISIQNAQVVEPDSGQVNMIFTVTLSAPAPAGGTSVNFTTVQQPASITTATAGDDYITTSGTVTFAMGEQVKTILVPVLSDNKKGESNETFLVQLSSPVNGTIANGTATGTILIMNQPGQLMISELRTSGPGGAGDDFVEIYNNSDSPHTVTSSDGSPGYGLFKMGAACGDAPVLIGVIPNGTIIPARGHYLFVGSAYSLSAYGASDLTLSSDIENDRNVGIFSTSALAGISSARRFDAVGFGSNTGGLCDLLREGTTLTPMVGSVLEYSFFRDECGKKGNPGSFGACPTGGATQDTNVNADDFIFAETTAAITVAGQRLGAPGPQGLGSPRFNNLVATLLLDATKGSTASPNRIRDTTPLLPLGSNGDNGTLSVLRRFVNNTGAPVTKLRFRIVDFSTIPTNNADLRALNSIMTSIGGVNDPATCLATTGSAATPCTVPIKAITVEQPPTQGMGGANNSSWNAATITLGTPLAPGASINIEFRLGVQSTGAFKFFFNVEALP